MISEFFVDLAVQFIAWLSGVFGEWTPPDELVSMTDGLAGVLATYDGMGVWVAWPVVNACIVAGSSTWLIVVGIKLVQKLIAHIPAFGGSGA